MIELPIRKVRPEAVVPTRAYEGDAGLDLSACARVELAPGERSLVPTGLAVAIPDGHAGFVQPRSGLAAEHGISIVNTDRATTFVVEPGMRIAQLVIVELPAVELVEVDELPESERGVRGFGSSRH